MHNETNNELLHYGVKGMRWGVRRHRNPDGTLTTAGQKRVYKTVKKYASAKDRRQALGQAVGEDELITEATRKVKTASDKYNAAVSSRVKLESKIEQEYFKEADRLDKKYGPDRRDQNRKDAVEIAFSKYKKEYDEAIRLADTARNEYEKTTREVVDAYLGKYGKNPVDKKGRTAGEALAIQMDWGINLGRLDKK